MKPKPGSHSADLPNLEIDLNLARAVSSGSIEDWHEFLNQYSGLIYTVTKRQLPGEEEDVVRSVYVDSLKRLYDGDLAKYQGKASLSTWLIVFARRRAFDHLRARYGRYREPKGLERLSRFDQEVLRLYYSEKMSMDIVVHMLKWAGHGATPERIAESVERIEDTLDRRYLNRIASQRSRWSSRNGSVQLLKYLVHIQSEFEKRAEACAPDEVLMRKEAGAAEERVRSLVSALPAEEQEIVRLRFDRGWSARRISDRLHLGGQRRVYTMIDRIVRKLRLAMAGGRPGGRRKDG